MSKPHKKPFRKRHLFARSVEDVVKEATRPLMSKQGKLYSALLRDWAKIVGPTRAAICRPERLQFATREASDAATLHLSVKPSAVLELSYELEPMLEQCARYFGYRAISRIVLHATPEIFVDSTETSTHRAEKISTVSAPLAQDIPKEMRDVFSRLAAHIASANDKKQP